jgi:hypothetical protein
VEVAKNINKESQEVTRNATVAAEACTDSRMTKVGSTKCCDFRDIINSHGNSQKSSTNTGYKHCVATIINCFSPLAGTSHYFLCKHA